MSEDYVLRGVNYKEYIHLKNEESKFAERAFGGLNNQYRPLVEDLGILIKYNTYRNAVGIFLQRNGKQHLALETKGLSPEENALVESLYNSLERSLEKLRLPDERWVELIEDNDVPVEGFSKPKLPKNKKNNIPKGTAEDIPF